jgi:hypothetical protein
MKVLVFAVLLATASGSSSVGSLYVRVQTAGLQIFIDGVAIGTSTAAEGGKLVRNVPVGQHRVVIRTEDGREAAFNVNIGRDVQSDVTVSPLGFRKLNRAPDTDESSMLRITSIPLEATIEFRGATLQNHDSHEMTLENIPPGKYPLVISQSGKAIRADVDIPKTSVVSLDVDSKASVFRVTDTKPRPRRLQINEANDALRYLNIPSNWKTAIRTALPNTISILDAWASGNAVKVRVKVPSEKMVEPLLESLVSSSAFSGVYYGSAPRPQGDGWVVDFVFRFAPS